MKFLKKLIPAATVILVALSAQAEINIGVAVPEQGNIQGNAIRILNSRLKTAVTQCGVSSTQWGDFFLVPTATVTSEEVVETGMSKITRYEIDMTLTIRQLTTDTDYGAQSWKLKGTGTTREKAMMNAFSAWKSDAEFRHFIESSKQSIETYFVTNREALMGKARQKANAGQYDEALAILSSYPTNLEGSGQVLAEMNAIYDHMLANECGEALLQARSALAMEDYSTAAEYIAHIAPDSPCVAEAKELQVKITARRDAVDQRQYQREQAQLDRDERQANAARSSHERLEKARYNAIASVAKAYYNRRMPTYHYHIHY